MGSPDSLVSVGYGEVAFRVRYTKKGETIIIPGNREEDNFFSPRGVDHRTMYTIGMSSKLVFSAENFWILMTVRTQYFWVLGSEVCSFSDDTNILRRTILNSDWKSSNFRKTSTVGTAIFS